ncbi:caspase family protein [Streptomyces sp. NPDC050804]|uniref:caspase family protein n=1 Tax=Streptomyces sp. NPDC050804 TaxID=3154745 RepID=UPI003437601D
MRTVYALLVGIDDYPRHPLNGCVNDVEAAEHWLRRQTGFVPEILRLRDERATKAAVTEGIRHHLGRSGPGDTALLWFSGHGSEETTDDPRSATGTCQALVCHDSLDEGGQPLLQDTELGALLDEIAQDGTHVIAVLDCCHSGGATREATARGVAWRPWWRTADPGVSRSAGAPGPVPREHVLLAACRPQEKAHEALIDGLSRGYFSHALLLALDRLGPAATYGALHSLVEERVRSAHHAQHPELRGPEDRLFLYGDAAAGSPFLLRHTTAGWEVNCGYTHGLRAPGAEFTVIGAVGTIGQEDVRRAGGARRVVVREVRAESSLVEPADWRPGADERETVHGVTPSALAFPPAVVTVVGQPDAVRAVSAAVASAPMLSLAGDRTGDRTGEWTGEWTGDAPALLVEAGGGRARVSGGGGHRLDPLPLRSSADADRVADCLTHIARWHQLRDLANPDPWLSSLVRVTVEPLVGDFRYTVTGEAVCSYTRDGREPQVRVRIHNDWVHPLWCVLLDLADNYESSPELYEGEFVAGGNAGMARRGEPVWLRLPPGRPVVRDAFARDWLKAIVTENELNIAPFRLPAWSPGTSGAARGGIVPAGGGGLLRFVPPRGGRLAGGPAHEVGRWGTASVLVRTEVP